MIPMYEPLQAVKCKKCGKLIAKPKECGKIKGDTVRMSASLTEFDIQMFAREVSKAIYSKFGSKLEEIAENAVKVLVSIDLKPFLVSCSSQGNPQQTIKNLTNAWYSECFLSYPSVYSMKDPISPKIVKKLNRYFETVNKHFGGWRYIIAYYSIFFALSAMLRAIDEAYKGGHKSIIKAFNSRFFSRRFPSKFMLHPFNAFKAQNSVTPDIFSKSFPTISKDLKIERGEKITILNLLYFAREKVNYEIMSRFARAKKQRYHVYLTLNLRRIVFLFNLIVEVFLIKCYGFDYLYRRFRTTIKYFGRSRIKPYPISIRFEIYEKYFKETRGILGSV